MTKVITYGTFDLFHQGHYNLLKGAKKLGDYLIVAVTSDTFDKVRGKLNVHDSLITRIKNVENSGFADEIIVEEYYGQKIDDIKKYNVDIFTVGSDWIGHFDYLKEYCKVIYLERTQGISSTELRSKNILNLGVIGAEDIITRFKNELKYVSGVNLVGVYDENVDKLKRVSQREEIKGYSGLESLLDDVDAIYVATPPRYHYKNVKIALEANKHVLCEFPFETDLDNAKELFDIAERKSLILMEALKTAYCPAFCKMVPIVKSGFLGDIISVDACFTQINGTNLQNQIYQASGGSVNALASYPLLAIVKFLGKDYKNIRFISKFDENNIDIYTRIEVVYENKIGSGIVAINAKNEGSLTVTGTKGYLYVPAPWWKTDYFEIRYENTNENIKYFYKFDGDGLRYEIVEFLKCIKYKTQTRCLVRDEVLTIVEMINKFNDNQRIVNI